MSTVPFRPDGHHLPNWNVAARPTSRTPVNADDIGKLPDNNKPNTNVGDTRSADVNTDGASTLADFNRKFFDI